MGNKFNPDPSKQVQDVIFSHTLQKSTHEMNYGTWDQLIKL